MREIVGARSFDDADQHWFAKVCGDVNPMHMDAGGAAATQAGERVVHGVHAVLWALEQLARHGTELAELEQLKVKFSKFITLGKGASLVVTDGKPQELRAEIDVEGAPGAVSLRLGFVRARKPGADDMLRTDVLPDLSAGPIVRDVGDFAEAHGRLTIPSGAEAEIVSVFPGLSKIWSPATVAQIALMSTVVGMVTPGLHSIFSDFTLTFKDRAEAPPDFFFSTTRFDPRFRLATIRACCGAFESTIAAYLRYPPVAPPRFRDIERVIPPDQFLGRAALVVGGSRGIGAVVSQAIAAGGGRVVATYAANEGAAKAIQADVRAHRPAGSFEICRFDSTNPSAISALDAFTDLFYFATPKIFDQSSEVFSAARHDAFCKIYLQGFHDLVMSLLKDRTLPLNVFYPSSVAVTERPKNMTEYAMAKAAGEILCRDLAKAHPLLDIGIHRLPRVMTDQTATVPPVAAPSALEAILPLLIETTG